MVLGLGWGSPLSDMSNPHFDIRWPDECRDRHSVGGKAASLGELAGAWPVPPFFCLAATDAGTWRESSGERGAPLRAAYDTLMGDAPVAVAVRSSAVGEDGEHASFAGQYASILDVIGFPAVLDAVERCLLSAASARAAAYLESQESAETPSMAVIVQRQVRADASAVAFSADPTTGDRDSILINAAWGLGDGVVSGSLTPDTFVVRRLDGAVSANLSDKPCMVVATGDGVAEVPVPAALRRYPSLTLGQVRQIAEMTEGLEARVGRPVDIECCVRGDRLHLLQCRPITALAGPRS